MRGKNTTCDTSWGLNGVSREEKAKRVADNGHKRELAQWVVYRVFCPGRLSRSQGEWERTGRIRWAGRGANSPCSPPACPPAGGLDTTSMLLNSTVYCYCRAQLLVNKTKTRGLGHGAVQVLLPFECVFIQY